MRLRREADPVTTIGDLVGLPRSSSYRQAKVDENAGLSLLLQDLAAQYPTYGYAA